MSKVEIIRRIHLAEAYKSRETLREDVIGETPPSPRGYFVRVSKVDLDHEGIRIRLRLFQNGEFVRHLDLTQGLANDLRRVLAKLD